MKLKEIVHAVASVGVITTLVRCDLSLWWKVPLLTLTVLVMFFTAAYYDIGVMDSKDK